MRDVSQNSFIAGMNKDLDPLLLKDGVYTNAINAQLNTHEGVSFITNEPANVNCLNMAFSLIGSIKLPSGKFALFYTDDSIGEIGVFDEQTCSYERVVRSTCLNFKRTNLIKGAAKTNFNCTESVYFTDGLNPRRQLNLNDVPYTFTVLDDECETKEFTTQLDCSELLVDKKISYPRISIEKSDGVLKNGAYQVAIAYAINNEIVTDWYGLTLPFKHFSHEQAKIGLDVKIENLDREFDQYALAVIYTLEGSTSVDRVGFYSTAQDKVLVSNVGNSSTNTVGMTIDEIVIKRPVYDTSDDIVSTSKYLLWTNPSTKLELDYQQTAMNIVPKWVAYRVPKEYYYQDGGKVGYLRDEVYAFGIQWLYTTGDWSPVYHIPGRKPTSRETSNVAGQDVYEKDASCEPEDLPKYFEVYNTAKVTKRYNSLANHCDPVIIAEGSMAYWESTEKYPDNEDLFGLDKCTPIRHHKMPDSSVIHVHDDSLGIDNGAIILGVTFENIIRPEDPTIVGYRIVRGDRRGNKSIIAKGLLFNTGNYEDNGNQCQYPNYPYNDLRQDPFLSTTQTKHGLKETDYNSFGNFNRDKFTFHSPNTAFAKPALGNELKIEVEEHALVKGRFEEVHKHPKYKFITNFSFGIANVLAIAGTILAIRGRKCVTAGTTPVATGVFEVGTGSTIATPSTFSYATECTTELMGKTGFFGGIIQVPNIAGIVLAVGYYYSQGLSAVFNTIKLLSNWQQHAYQYNSHGFYSGYSYVRSGNRRRRIDYAQYLIPGNQDINGVRMNNFNRETSVYLELNSNLANPQVRDISRGTINSFGLCDSARKENQSTASSYYSAIKRKYRNQYGQLDSINYLDTGEIFTEEFSGHVFGGDTYVGRFTEKRKFTYYLLWPYDVPDGYEWDYRKYANIPYPRFWIDGTEYDVSTAIKGALRIGLLGLLSRNQNADENFPGSKHNLDCSRAAKNIFVVKDRYFYLFNSGVIDYYAESEYNPAYRDWEDSIESKHYDWYRYTNLSEMFRSDKIQFDNKFLFDTSYLKQLTENFIPKQSSFYDPNDLCSVKFDNRVIYSLPANQEEVRDNWLIYPGLNYFDFSKELGNLTTIQTFDRDRLIFLFDKSGPFETLGVDTLQTDAGTKILLGDGGLFAQEPQRVVYTKHGYGNSQSKFAWSSNQFGSFYVSQRQGRVFQFNGQLKDISRNGMHWWFKNYLPSKLLEKYPDFKHSDNMVMGVGTSCVFDNTNEVLYITKRDYKVKDKWLDVVTYDATTDKFKFKNITVDFPDPFVFEDVSWTVSYDPKSEVWVSFHDWHPDFMVQTENHFITSKDDSLWKHNQTCERYCNFYGIDRPFEVDVTYKFKSISTVSNLEYNLECYEYKGSCSDKFHLLEYNFDHMFVYNSEQTSGLIQLERRPNTMLSPFPIFDANRTRSEYSKVENRYRVNQFFDLTKDRQNGKPLMLLEGNGYKKLPNTVAIDYGKKQRKKFRNIYNNVILRRTVSGPVSMRLKLSAEKLITSPR